MLMIGLVALVFSSCQSDSGKKEVALTPTLNGASSEQTPSAQRPANNPAHGQPFHDCALPVGAAFAAENPAAQPAALPAPVNLQPEVQQQAAPATKEVKLNPAHGAPGHKCELPVGAPLS
ncbi:hypothetical protein [Pedobacter immunditicola]|uniref:hypothetical protein n=1 Tax=Pedobacter immunditicola TaxID=3133440 RepID=UPI0030A32360